MISYWEIFVIVAIIAIILEMFAPMMFFLSIALAALITAIAATFISSGSWLIVICSVLSVILLLFVRPLIKNAMHKLPAGVEFNTEYIGKCAKVIEDVTETSGSVTIYGERWDARLADKNSPIIPKGSEAKIVRNESIILYVEKV